MITKSNRFNLDWWVVQKRFIYIAITLLVLSVVAGGTGLYVWKYGNPLRHAGTGNAARAGARFISYEGDVRIMRAATRETVAASNQTQLYSGDTVQTQADGRARIGMADGSTLVVRPNSTVIIRDNNITEEGHRTNVHVVVDSGQINVRTEQQPDGTNNIVETPKTRNQVGSQTGASFGVNPDNKTEEIRVNTGQIETATNGGDKTTVRGGEYVSINPSGTLANRQRLLEVPAPAAPRDLEKVLAGASGAASVALRWQRPASGLPAYYRVEVATSPFFVASGRVIERDQLGTTEFNASDLRPGVYFWRVRATASSGQTSDWSDPLKFIVLLATGERVAVSDWSAKHVGGNIYLIRGRALPGTTILIAGRETLVASDGSFQLQITAPAGAREIIAEANDPQGNKNQYRVPLSTGDGR